MKLDNIDTQSLDELLDSAGFQEEVDNYDYYNTIGKEITEEDLKEYNNTHAGIDMIRHSIFGGQEWSKYNTPGTKEWDENVTKGRNEWEKSKLARYLKS